MTLMYESFGQARNHLKDILDAADEGLPVGVQRNGGLPAAVVNLDRLRSFLARTLPAAEVLAEDSGWSVFIPESFIAADGPSLEVAIEETIDALRDYSEDWRDHLLHAPNHAGQWGLVQFVSLSTNAQLREWLVRER